MVKVVIQGSEAEIRAKGTQILAEVRNRIWPQLRKGLAFQPAKAESKLPPPANPKVVFETKPGLTPVAGAKNSLAGKQAVSSGAAGLNISIGAPPPNNITPQSIGMEHLETWLRGRRDALSADRAYRRKIDLTPPPPVANWTPRPVGLKKPPRHPSPDGVAEFLDRKHKEKVAAKMANPYLIPRS